MFEIASTRFNSETYNDNLLYRHKINTPVIYGTCVRIQDKYQPDLLLFVVEMNNETNKIEGIGLIRNQLSLDFHKIYKNNDYNRYIYTGEYWLKRDSIEEKDSELVFIFDTILFKGKSHLKRVAGISVITKKLLTNWNYELSDLKKRVKKIFIDEFKGNGGVPEEDEEKEKEKEEIIEIEIPVNKKRKRNFKNKEEE